MPNVETPNVLGELTFPTPDGSQQDIGEIQVPQGEIWYVEEVIFVSVAQGSNLSNDGDYNIRMEVGFLREGSIGDISVGVGETRAEGRYSGFSIDFGLSLDTPVGSVEGTQSIGEYIHENESIAFVERADNGSSSGQLKAVVLGRKGV